MKPFIQDPRAGTGQRGTLSLAVWSSRGSALGNGRGWGAGFGSDRQPGPRRRWQESVRCHDGGRGARGCGRMGPSCVLTHSICACTACKHLTRRGRTTKTRPRNESGFTWVPGAEGSVWGGAPRRSGQVSVWALCSGPGHLGSHSPSSLRTKPGTSCSCETKHSERHGNHPIGSWRRPRPAPTRR